MIRRCPSAEVVFAGHGLANLFHFVAGELDQLVALLAVQMIVLRVTVIVLVDGPVVEHHLAQQAGIDQLGQGAIDRGAAYALPTHLLAQLLEQLIGVEMLVVAENPFDDDPPLLGDPFATALQEFLEPLERRQADVDGAEGKIMAHERVPSAIPVSRPPEGRCGPIPYRPDARQG